MKDFRESLYWQKNYRWLEAEFAVPTKFGYYNARNQEMLTSMNLGNEYPNAKDIKDWDAYFDECYGIKVKVADNAFTPKKAEKINPLEASDSEKGKGIVSTFTYQSHKWLAEGKLSTKEENDKGLEVKVFTFATGFDSDLNQSLTIALGKKGQKGKGWSCKISRKEVNDNGSVDVYLSFHRNSLNAKFEIKEKLIPRLIMMGRAYPVAGNLHILAND